MVITKNIKNIFPKKIVPLLLIILLSLVIWHYVNQNEVFPYSSPSYETYGKIINNEKKILEIESVENILSPTQIINTPSNNFSQKY